MLSFSAPEAREVLVAGDFNGWETCSDSLKRSKQGIWTTTLNLPPGSYEYRFLVDGDWCNDPHCADTIRNCYGTENCVLRVEDGNAL